MGPHRSRKTELATKAPRISGATGIHPQSSVLSRHHAVSTYGESGIPVFGWIKQGSTIGTREVISQRRRLVTLANDRDVGQLFLEAR